MPALILGNHGGVPLPAVFEWHTIPTYIVAVQFVYPDMIIPGPGPIS